jgi:putative ABC transport system permease protein
MTGRDFTAQLWDTLRANRLRTGLTMFGIVWGVALTLLMSGFSDSIRDSFVSEIERFGSREVLLWPGHKQGQVGGFRAGRDLRFDDRSLEAIRAHCPSLQSITPQFWADFAQVKFGARLRSFPLIGAFPALHDIRSFPAARGRRIDDADMEARRAVAFIGDNVRQRLFGPVDPLGRAIRINNIPFRVVGVAARKGDALFQQGWQDDDVVLIPSTTAQRLFVSDPHYQMLILQAVTREASYQLVEEVRRTLGALHHFRVEDKDALAFFNTVDNVMRTINIQRSTGVLGSVMMLTTLFIGGIGLMNILVVSVNERTREIGLRRALGASRVAIMTQFLAESLTVTLVAGSIGVALALLVSAVMRLLPLPALFHTPTMPLVRIVVVFLFMVAVGLLAGVVPARRAAALDPAVALRYE